MLSYLAYNMRFSGEQSEAYAENLILSALRLLQDCPSNGIALRKVCNAFLCRFMLEVHLTTGTYGCFPPLNEHESSSCVV